MQDRLSVSICCITYNHALYLRQCLDSLVMQKTSFPFEILVHDDASTDGTTDIIREYAVRYPDIIKPYFQRENQYSQGKGFVGISINLNRARGRYIAFCEGDDFWTDPLKLQKQVDILETHEGYALTYAKSVIVDKDGNAVVPGQTQGLPTDFFLLMRGYNQIPTASAMYTREKVVQYLSDIQPDSRSWKMADYPMVLYFFRESKVHFSDEVMCAYRVLQNSASHADDENRLLPYYYSILDIKLFFYQHYQLRDKRLLKDIIREHHRLLRDRYKSHSYGRYIGRLTTKLPFGIKVEYMKTYVKSILRKQH